jgi:hypothetical protein
LFQIFEQKSLIGKSMKKEYSTINAVAIKKVAKKHSVTIRFAYQCINRERHSATAEEILKDYRKLLKELEQVLS